MIAVVVLVLVVVAGSTIVILNRRSAATSHSATPRGRRDAAAAAKIQQGTASRAELAQWAQSETRSAHSFGVAFADDEAEGAAGVLVASVADRTGAARIGLREGDRILSIDGISVSDPSSVEQAIEAKHAGLPLYLVWQSEGKHREGSVIL